MSSSPPSVLPDLPPSLPPSLPPFVTRFGLGVDADERAVKRAYARELKQIDQELDPAAFQDLREARDAALYWLQVRQYEREQEERERAKPEAAPAVPPGDAPAALDAAAAAAPEVSPAQDAQAQAEPRDPAAAPLDAPRYENRHPELIYPDDPPPAAAEPAAPRPAAGEPARPEAVGEVVFGEFADELGVTSHFGQRVLSAPQLKQQLERFLDDPRLLQIDAKDVFEWLIARMLAQGWKPGHETLMEVATARFDWSSDRRRLYRFGQAGQVLDRYLQELSAFEQEDEPTRNILLDTLRNLRLRPEPPADEPESMRRAEYLAARFPHLLGLLANGDNFENWRKLTAAVQQRQQRAARAVSDAHEARGAAALAGTQSKGSGKSAAIFFAVIVALMGLVRLITPDRMPDLGGMPATTIKQSSSGDGSRPPLTEAALTGVLNSTIGPANCQAVADYARERGVGTTYPRAAPGAEFDRFVLSCVTGGNWPGKLENDVVVASSIARLKGRADYDNLVKGAVSRVKVAQMLANNEALAAAKAAKAGPAATSGDPGSLWGRTEFERAQIEAKRADALKESERIRRQLNALQPVAPAAASGEPAKPAYGSTAPPVLRGEAWYKGEIERQAGGAPKPADQRLEWDRADYSRISRELGPPKLGEPHYGGSARRPTDATPAEK